MVCIQYRCMTHTLYKNAHRKRDCQPLAKEIQNTRQRDKIIVV